MQYQNQPPLIPLSSQTQPQTPPPKPRFTRLRGWLRSRTGRVVIPLAALCVGIGLGIVAIVLYGLSGEGQIVIAPSSGRGNIVVEADKAFLAQLVTNNLRDSGMPGQIENVRVNLANGDQMTVNGDDGFSVLGVGLTRHYTFVVQPYVSSCFLQVHVVHADFSNVPVTGFAHIFESHINQQLQMKPEGLPIGFQYCTTGVRTEPSGMFVTYTATPV
jgi:hypothetical protein